MLVGLEWVFAGTFGLFATKSEREVLTHERLATVVVVKHAAARRQWG
jgi:hypothetical protein